MTGRTINHRRERQHARRILAEICIRGRDLTGSYFPEGIDLFDHQHRMPVNDNRDAVAVTERPRA
jgi:hypothetical protein